MTRNEVLKMAEELINGDRAKDYGEAITNHQRISAGWNVITRAAFENYGYLCPAHVTLMMDWLKTCRLLETIEHQDSWVDKIGYNALGAEFMLNKERSVVPTKRKTAVE